MSCSWEREGVGGPVGATEDDNDRSVGDARAVSARVDAKVVDNEDGAKAGMEVVHFPLDLLLTGNGRRIGFGCTFLRRFG